MILEAAHIPSQFIKQESDWKKLCDQFPGLGQYFLQENAIQESLKEAYRDYISNFSASLISLSLNRTSFLFFFSKLIHAKKILDLGSGFSSYMFRPAHPGAVISVDDSESWLMETKCFLEKYKLDSSELRSLNQYVELKDRPVADLCFLDLGDISLKGTSKNLLRITFTPSLKGAKSISCGSL